MLPSRIGINPLGISRVAKPCFVKKDSHPPVCGVHGFALVKEKIAIDEYAPHLGYVICHRCPVSNAVV
jgi:hypothetical protein